MSIDNDENNSPVLDIGEVVEMTKLSEVDRTPENTVSNTVFGSLFANESIGILTAKIAILESFLSLATRDCNFAEFMRELLVAIMKAVMAEAGSILEINQDNGTMFFRAVVGRSSEQLVDFVIPGKIGIAGHAVESKTTVLVNNVPENSEHLRSIEKAVGFETRNMIAVPILLRGKAYGVLELLNRVGEDNFTDSDVELLEYICQMASKAIEIRMMIAWTARTAAGG